MKVTVFNVGQGDSFLIQHSDCTKRPPLLVDTGCANKSVYKKILSKGISIDDALDVMITHSHSDHMNGLPDILNKYTVKNLFIPYYLPEMLQITKILGRKFKKFPVHILDKMKHFNTILLNAGDYVYGSNNNNDFKVLYPQSELDGVFGYLHPTSDTQLSNVITRLNELGLEVSLDDILAYYPEFYPQDSQQEYVIQAREFIRRVFASMSMFVFHSTAKNIIPKIRKHLELISNHTSIVFRCHSKSQDNENIVWLFTGDADIDSFMNIYARGPWDLHNIDMLKVPHHGSRENLNSFVLNLINPSYAVISHDNKSKNSFDGHPNDSVIKALERENISVFYTNDVKKNIGTIRYSDYNAIFSNIFDFID